MKYKKVKQKCINKHCRNGYFKVKGCFCCKTLTASPWSQVSGALNCYGLKNNNKKYLNIN